MSRKSRETRQKEEIATVIGKLKGFFTAEDVYKKVADTGIGIATIYRYLKQARKEGQLHSYVCNKKQIYANEHKSHCHFICENCGKTIHFDVTDINSLQKSVPGSICHFQINVHGTCKKCQKS